MMWLWTVLEWNWMSQVSVICSPVCGLCSLAGTVMSPDGPSYVGALNQGMAQHSCVAVGGWRCGSALCQARVGRHEP